MNGRRFFLLLGVIAPLARLVAGSAFEGFWSDCPAYTILFPHQLVPAVTSEAFEGVRIGAPVRPTPPPSYPKHRAMGEGVDILCERTYALTEGRYTNPARLWEGEPYPLGNGFTGVSVFHGSGRDRYTLSSAAFWSGGANPGIDALGDKPYNGSHGPDSASGFGGQQPVADLLIDFAAPVHKEGFRRELDFDTAAVRAIAIRNGITIHSEAFCSYPDRVVALRYTANAPLARVAITLARNRPSDTLTLAPSELILDATLANGLQCRSQSRLVHCDAAQVEVTPEALILKDVRQWTLLTVVETNYEMSPALGFRGTPAAERCAARFSALADFTFEALRERHRADTRALYRRLALRLDAPERDLPTPQRLAAYRDHPEGDPALEALFLAFGRYLLIATSRPGGLPAGLQGIWNPYPEAPWGNDYHSNINAQMVYWLAERGALPECHRALLDYLLAMRPCFQRATTEYFIARGEKVPTSSGWLVYTSHNPFGAGGWRINLPASAWYALHFRDHAAFAAPSPTRWDEALPLLTELSAFWLQRLKALGPGGEGFCSNGNAVDPRAYPELAALPVGALVVPKGWSPEHGPREEDGVAHDQQIVSELFQATLTAAHQSGHASPLLTEISEAAARLVPPQIGQRGNLMEWLIDRDPETDHRHTSHLFALYPGTLLSPSTTPTLATAAERSLRLRKTTGDSRRSWAWAWRAALWARLHRGEESHAMVQGLLQHNVLDNGFASHRIPLQIDGNYGIAAAILEQIVQSRSGMIELLPALPTAWAKGGSLHGVRAHDGIRVSLQWREGRVVMWSLEAKQPTTVSVQANGKTYSVTAPCTIQEE
jgi:alpha-L-fucosidase 2